MAEKSNKYSVLISVIFFLSLGTAIYLGKVNIYIVWLYVALSAYTFFIYARDKSAAKKGKWRTPEQTLHVYSFLCGWPGALVAHQYLRHKTQKKSFRTTFWLTVILNLSLLIWLHTPHGLNLIKSIIK